VLRRLMTVSNAGENLLGQLVEQYESALEECGDNHDEIDYEIAKAQEEVNSALGPARGPAAKKLRNLRLYERVQIYWLYIATWATPLLIGVGLWFFAPPA
jgi:hypothetical protein